MTTGAAALILHMGALRSVLFTIAHILSNPDTILALMTDSLLLFVALIALIQRSFPRLALICSNPYARHSAHRSSKDDGIQARSPRALRRRWLQALLCLATLAVAIPALYGPTLALSRLGVEAGLWLPGLIGVAHYLPFEERLVEVGGGNTTQCARQDKVTFGESVAIDEQAWICGDVTAYGGNVLVRRAYQRRGARHRRQCHSARRCHRECDDAGRADRIGIARACNR